MWFLYALTVGLWFIHLSDAQDTRRPWRHFRNRTVCNDNANTVSARQSADQGIRSIGYFGNWVVYARDYQPQAVPVDRLTHIFYAFADVRNDTGEVFLTDLSADIETRYSTDKVEEGTNAYGSIKQLFLHKKRHRNLKVLLSIGGWTYSSNFTGAASSEARRENFATTAVRIMEDVGFDGIDIDWEYPSNDQEASNWVNLLASTRQALDAAQATRTEPTRFVLSVACPAGPQHYQHLRVAEMDEYLDFWNLMAYDYAGSWDQTSGHQANLYRDESNHSATPFSTDAAVQFYTGNGVSPYKMTLGIPLYGRTFQQTGGPGDVYQGIGNGSWEPGIWDYKDLPKLDSREHYDDRIGASWSYSESTRTMISYDTPEMVRAKAQYSLQHGLGGAMWWELSADKTGQDGSLIEAFISEYGGTTALAQEQNCLEYPSSKYDNIRDAMAQES